MTSKIMPNPKDHSDGIVSLFLGKSGSGKSHLMVSLFHHYYRNIYPIVFLLCPTFRSKRNSELWTKLNAKGKLVVYTYFNMDLLQNIIDKIPIDNQQNILIILDDCIAESGFSKSTHRNDDPLTKLAIRGKHKRISLWVSSQILRVISTTLRSNSTNIFLFKYNNTQEIRKYSSFSPYSAKKFVEYYNKVIQDKEKNFLYIYDGNLYNKLTLIKN